MTFSTFHVYPTEQSPVMVSHASLFTVQVRSVRTQKNGGIKKSDSGKRFQDIRRNYYEGKPVYVSPTVFANECMKDDIFELRRKI